MQYEVRQLLKRMKQSDRAAFAELVSLTAPHMAAIISLHFEDDTKASDVLRQVYLDIWKRRDSDLFSTAKPLDILRAFVRFSLSSWDAGNPALAVRFFERVPLATSPDWATAEIKRHRANSVGQARNGRAKS